MPSFEGNEGKAVSGDGEEMSTAAIKLVLGQVVGIKMCNSPSTFKGIGITSTLTLFELKTIKDDFC